MNDCKECGPSYDLHEPYCHVRCDENIAALEAENERLREANDAWKEEGARLERLAYALRESAVGAEKKLLVAQLDHHSLRGTMRAEVERLRGDVQTLARAVLAPHSDVGWPVGCSCGAGDREHHESCPVVLARVLDAAPPTGGRWVSDEELRELVERGVREGDGGLDGEPWLNDEFVAAAVARVLADVKEGE